MALFTSRFVAAAALAGSLGAGAGEGARHATFLASVYDAVVDPRGRVPGIRIRGRALARDESVRAAVERCASDIEHTPLRLIPSGTSAHIDTTTGDLGVRVDTAAMIRRAESIGHRGSLAVRIQDRIAASRGGIDIPADVGIDGAKVARLLAPLKEDTDEHPVAARWNFAEHRAVPHHDGAALDIDKAIANVLERANGEPVLRKDGGDVPRLVVELERVPLAPPLTEASLAHLDLSATISEYATTFADAGHDAPRATNIAVAAAHLDGVVIAPGSVASFNDVVGPRTVDNGFAHAFQIYKGEMVAGIGGGTCQVSSTLHAAAMYAGMDIVERAPHSRPLGYIPLGLDSTVVYPEVDLKIRNPWAYPVAIHTVVEKNRVRVSLLGKSRPDTVSVSLETLHVEPFTRRVEVHPELPAGRYLRKQKGIRGYDIRVTRRTYETGQPLRVETSLDRYPETPELFWVAPEFDTEHGLPPPAEGSALNPTVAAASPENDAQDAR